MNSDVMVDIMFDVNDKLCANWRNMRDDKPFL